MPTLVSLRSRLNGGWPKALADSPGPLAQALLAMRLEGLELCLERATLRVYLGLDAPLDAALGDALRQRLAQMGYRPVLYPRYSEGLMAAEDFLGLHFRDLVEQLREELDLAPDWLSGADYKLEGQLGHETLVLLTESDYLTRSLAERRAARALTELIASGLGAGMAVELRTGEGLAPAAAVEAPSAAKPEAALPAAPAASPALVRAPVAAPERPAPKPEAKAKPVPAEGRALAGRLLPADRSKPMDQVRGPEAQVQVEGTLFELKETKLKGGESTKLRFAFSDGSDSLYGVFWVRKGESAPKELAAGARVRVRGEAKVDRFERDELVLEARDITLLPKHQGREDKAAEKRVELHAHTKYSAADSVAPVEALVKTAIRFGHPALAITDHGVVHALPKAAKAAWSKGGPLIKLILGCEGYLVESGDIFNPDRSLKGPKPESRHIILLARNDQGRRNLYRLVSGSHLETFYSKPLIPRARLAELREGLILGSACENGELMQALLAGADDAELERIASFYDYLEVQPPANNRFMLRNGQVKDEEGLRDLVRQVLALGERLGKPVVATGDVHYLEPEDEVYRRIMQVGNGMADAEEQAPLWFHTTEEMLAAFSFLPPETAHRIVVAAPRAIAESIGHVAPVPKDRCFPKLEGTEERITAMAWEKLKAIYGPVPPELAGQRLDYELGKVKGNGFAVLYEIAQKLVAESNQRGYSVGSRGSVGSSLAAWCLGISEVNPLPAHEHCRACRWTEFHPKERLSGIDLKPRPCPACGSQDILRDGHNIPFETFVGIKGDKVPDIDLNFAPEVQNEIQHFVVSLFGEGKAYKAGTVSTYSDKTAFGYVKRYYEGKGLPKRNVEIERVMAGLKDVKKNTGSHPGGVVLVPAGHTVEEFTPVQYSGDSKERGGQESMGVDSLPITHFEYHDYEENLVKLDILGKDDGSAFRQLASMTGVAELDAPLDEPKALSIFREAKALGLPKLGSEEEGLFGKTGALGIPEFGTPNTRRMLEMTKPKSFTELIYISGLSHGTNVWNGNAEELIKAGKADLSTVISTRDDIMNRLTQAGMEQALAFDITEKVRKGKVAAEGFTPEQEAAIKAVKMPDWWMDSCRKIQYMFPKAHATAYCFTAARMAWFKVHHPLAFYATWLTLNRECFDLAASLKGREGVLASIGALRQAQQAGSATAKEEGALEVMTVVLEALLRGMRIAPVDLYASHPAEFAAAAEPNTLLPPLTVIPGLGGTAAVRVAEERARGEFRSIEDLVVRCSLNKSVVEKLKASGALGGLPDSDQISLF